MDSDEFLRQVGDFTRRKCLLDIDKISRPVLVALSGGADSVALLLVLRRLGADVVAAHCNFGLRGEESDRDERFVRELCARHDVRCEVRRFDVAAYRQTHNASVEMACRELRYEWFENLRQELDCEAIAVAHHADDDIETFFLNALRGTGIVGVAGMKPRNGAVVRPLLAMRRTDVEKFVEDCGESFVTDSTNSENEFKRNRIRNVVIPALEEQFPDARQRFTATITNLKECSELYQHLVSDNLAQYIVKVDKDKNGIERRVEVSCKLLDDDPEHAPLLFFEFARNHGFSREITDRLLAMYYENKYSGKYFYSSTHTLTIKRNNIVIERNDNLKQGVSIVDLLRPDTYPSWLVVEPFSGRGFTPEMVNGTTSVALVSSQLCLGEIVIRPWRQGDRIRPFGMKGTKLVSDLLTERGFTMAQKRAVRVMELGGEIIWVVGVRASEVLRVKPGCTDFVLLKVAEEGE